MSDRFYKVVRAVGSPALLVSSRPVVLGREHVPREGAVIVAATHGSPFDVALMIRHSPRPLDFVSITEVFRNPLVAWFYGSMNAFPLERSRPDPAMVRVLLGRLGAGRAVAMFPEGRIQTGSESVVHSRKIRRGLGRIAALSGAPVVPCVVVNAAAYGRISAWLPLRGVRYGIVFGRPMRPDGDPDRFEAEYIEEVVRLHGVLVERMAGGPTKARAAGQGGHMGAEASADCGHP